MKHKHQCPYCRSSYKSPFFLEQHKGLQHPNMCHIRPDLFGNGGCKEPRIDGSRFCKHHTEQVLKAATGRRANWQ